MVAHSTVHKDSCSEIHKHVAICTEGTTYKLKNTNFKVILSTKKIEVQILPDCQS